MKHFIFVLVCFSFILVLGCAKRSKSGTLTVPTTEQIGAGIEPDKAGYIPAKFGGASLNDGTALTYKTPEHWRGRQEKVRLEALDGIVLAANPNAVPGSPARIKIEPQPPTLDFGAWPTHFTSVKLLAVITNEGGSDTLLKLTGLPRAPFYVVGAIDESPQMLMLEVIFSPEVPGEFAENIVMVSRNGSITNEHQIALIGKAYDRKIVAAAGEGGSPTLSIFNLRTNENHMLSVGDPNSRGGLGGVAIGDVTGDFIPEIIVGSGKDVPGHVTILDGRTEAALQEVPVFDGFTGGVHVAVGDINGDSVGDIVAGAGPGGGPRVTVLDGRSGFTRSLMDFFAYEQSMIQGVNVASGDITGDFKSDVMVGTGHGGGPLLKAFSGSSGELLMAQMVGDQNAREGLEIATDYFNGDNNADIVASGGHGQLSILSGATNAELGTFTIYENAPCAVRVGTMYFNNDLIPEIITGAGKGCGPRAKVLEPLNGGFLKDYFAFEPEFRGGLYVGGM